MGVEVVSAEAASFLFVLENTEKYLGISSLVATFDPS